MRERRNSINFQQESISSRRLTINDIADLAGVSKKSVSRVINGEGGVSEDTRRNIRTIMSEVGFVPSRKARALATSKSYLLGLVHNNPNASYVMELALGAQEVAGVQGFEVVVHAVAGGGMADLIGDIKKFVARAGCDGLLVVPPLSESVSLMVELLALKIPLVRIAGDETDLQIRQIRCREQPALFDLTNRLLKKGHEEFAFIGGSANSGSTRRRLSAVSDVIAATKGSARLSRVEFGDYTFAAGLKFGQMLLESTPMPTAVMCANDEMAAGVIHAALSTGVSVPEDLSVTGFDDAPLATQIWPPITSVRQPIRAMSVRAITLLLDTDLPADHVEDFACSVVERQSTGAHTTGTDQYV